MSPFEMEKQNNSKILREPVCGMLVEPESTELRLETNGITHYFCSLGCLETFKEHPQEYTVEETTDTARAQAHDHVPSAGEAEGEVIRGLLCPMHLEVFKEWPKCPK